MFHIYFLVTYVAVALVGAVVDVWLHNKESKYAFSFSIFYVCLLVLMASFYLLSEGLFFAFGTLAALLVLALLVSMKLTSESNRRLAAFEVEQIKMKYDFDLKIMNLQVEHLRLDARMAEENVEKARKTIADLKAKVKILADEIEEVNDRVMDLENYPEIDSEWDEEE